MTGNGQVLLKMFSTGQPQMKIPWICPNKTSDGQCSSATTKIFPSLLQCPPYKEEGMREVAAILRSASFLKEVGMTCPCRPQGKKSLSKPQWAW